VELPEGWVRAAFKDPRKPFHIDIGSARGRFCVDMAFQFPDMNFLGLEIRRPCVEEAFKKRERAGADAGGNCHFLACNANVDLARVVAGVHAEGAEIVRCTCDICIHVCVVVYEENVVFRCVDHMSLLAVWIDSIDW
jgi:hypothetical protein